MLFHVKKSILRNKNAFVIHWKTFQKVRYPVKIRIGAPGAY